MQLSRGSKISIGMHIVLLVLVIFGLPAFFDMKREEQEVVISVELLPVTGVDNIKPAASKPAPQLETPKEQPKPVEQPKEQPKPEAQKPAPASSAALVPPTPAKEVVKEDAPKEKEKPKEEAKPKPTPEKPKEKEKPKEDDLDAILKSVAKAAKTEEKTNPTKTPKPTEAAAPAKEVSDAHNNSKNYNPDMPLSMSELSAIQSQIIKCWNIPAGAKDAHTLVVVLRVQLNQDGSLINAQLAENQARYNSDTFFRAAADSAMRAVRRCSPLQGLPVDKYGTWKDFELNFDPKDALY